MKNPLAKKQKTHRRVSKSSDVKVNRYISPRKTRKQEGGNKRKTSKRKRLVGKALLFIVLVVLAGVFLWLNSFVTEVAVNPEQQNYRSSIERYLSRNPLASLKPLISAEAITNTLMGEFPQIESADIEMPFFGGNLYVDITERQAQLVLRTFDNQYFIVDRNGYAYDSYDPSQKNDKVVILTDDTGVTYDLEANRFVPSAVVEYIEQTDKALKTVPLYKDQKFSYRLTDEARVIYVKPSKEKYEVKMQLDRSPKEQIASLQSALRFYVSKGIKPAQYVDVRVAGTVYYK